MEEKKSGSVDFHDYGEMSFRNRRKNKLKRREKGELSHKDKLIVIKNLLGQRKNAEALFGGTLNHILSGEFREKLLFISNQLRLRQKDLAFLK